MNTICDEKIYKNAETLFEEDMRNYLEGRGSYEVINTVGTNDDMKLHTDFWIHKLTTNTYTSIDVKNFSGFNGYQTIYFSINREQCGLQWGDSQLGKIREAYPNKMTTSEAIVFPYRKGDELVWIFLNRHTLRQQVTTIERNTIYTAFPYTRHEKGHWFKPTTLNNKLGFDIPIEQLDQFIVKTIPRSSLLEQSVDYRKGTTCQY